MYERFISLLVACFKGKDIECVTDVIKSGWVLIVGSSVKEFEEKLARYVQAKWDVGS